MRQVPLRGRLFNEQDEAHGDRIAVLTAAYWTRRFGRDEAVLGRVLNVDGIGHTIVGVLQESDGPLERDVALFTPARWPTPTRKGPFSTMALGRLRPGYFAAGRSRVAAGNQREAVSNLEVIVPG